MQGSASVYDQDTRGQLSGLDPGGGGVAASGLGRLQRLSWGGLADGGLGKGEAPVCVSGEPNQARVSAQGPGGIGGGGRWGLQEADQRVAGDGGVKRGAHKAGCDGEDRQTGFLADAVIDDREHHAGCESTHDRAHDHAETAREHPAGGPEQLPPQDQPLKRSDQDSDSERGQKNRGYEGSVDSEFDIHGRIHVGADNRTEKSADTAGHDPPAGLGEAPT